MGEAPASNGLESARCLAGVDQIETNWWSALRHSMQRFETVIAAKWSRT